MIIDHLEDVEGLLVEPRVLYDQAVIGVCYRTSRAIYSIEKLIKLTYKHENLTLNAAIDHVYQNIVSAYMGKLEPIYFETNENI